jgi:hypothetical protein
LEILGAVLELAGLIFWCFFLVCVPTVAALAGATRGTATEAVA